MDKRTILIVDDNSINRQILCKILSGEYNIMEAENGEIALRLLRSNYDTISVVLLDIVMPVLDGYSVLEHMHQDGNLSKIPVIVASGQRDQESEEKALSLGANDYIVKPYKPAIIKHRIANTIYLRETAAFVNSIQHDSLTGVYSKEYFYTYAKEMIVKNPEKQYDIVCCDIERFKLVNDLYGTATGDKLLQHVAELCEKYVAGKGICGRIGVDVFAFLVERPEEYDQDYFVKFAGEINMFDIKLNIVIRYGVYRIVDFHTPVNIMCDRACLAKESVKGKYNTYFAYYDDSFRQKMLNEQFITLSMKSALEQGQFKVYFQPKYEIKTRKIAGAEALVRWIHPENGLMSPAEFIPLFEKNGFISDLDIYIWDQCCQKIRSWIDAGHTPIPLSVNMSRADIYNLGLCDILLSMIKKYKLSPRLLHLEITEAAYTENPDQLIDVVTQLKKLGFVIEMDDFGSGYSSLNMLSELPIDILKLDMRFLQGDKAPGNRNILSFIISLAKWLDLSVIAEGVETKEHVHLLQSLNCECAQGYFFSKPLPQQDFEDLLLQSEYKKIGENTGEIPAEHENAPKGNKNTILVLDSSGEDFETIHQNFKQDFQVLQMMSMGQSADMVQKLRENITILVLNGKDLSEKCEVEMICGICRAFHISVLLLQHLLNEHTDLALEMGMSDILIRPYTQGMLCNRVQNVIYRSQIEQLQKEKEVNAVIMEMKKRAEQDSLTELLNRAEFQVRISDFFHKNNNPEGIFIIMDIDNFKAVNDNFGHMTGDKILCTVAEELRQVFPETGIISRMGGDEFGVFIPYRIDDADLKDKMEKVCNARVGANLTFSCSGGVCRTPQNGMDYEQLYAHGDIALLTAKRRGKGQYIEFVEDMELPYQEQFDEKALHLLDDTAEAMFVSNAITSEIIYINDTACQVIGKEKYFCLGKRCYELFWDQCRNCDRCLSIDDHFDDFYEEDTYLKDHVTKIHIRAKVGEWDGQKVKIHYIQCI